MTRWSAELGGKKKATTEFCLCLALVALCGLYTTGCSESDSTSARVSPPGVVPVDDDIAKQLHIKTEIISKRPLSSTLHFTGQIHPEFGKEVDVNTRLAGRVVATLTRTGQVVTKGQRLALLDSQEIGDLQAEMIEADSKLQVAKAQEERERQIFEEQLRRPKSLLEARTTYHDAKVQLSLAENEFKRIQTLLQEKIAATKDFIQAEGNFHKAKAAYEQAHADLEREEGLFKNRALMKRDYVMAQAERRAAQQHLNTLKQRLIFLGMTPAMVESVLSTEKIGGTVQLVAPADGTITMQDVYEGETVDPGKKAFVITDLRTVAASANIPEVDLQYVTLGGTVQITVASLPGEKFTGTIYYVGSEVSADTRTVPIRVRLNNPGLRLKANMFAEIDLAEASPAVIACPKGSVHEERGNNFVYVLANNVFMERPVKLGRADEKYIEVISGLQEGDKVATEGSLLLKTEFASAKRAAPETKND